MLSRLRSDIQCILDRDPAARSTWEVITCYPGLHAIWWHIPAHWCWTHNLKWLGRFTSHIGFLDPAAPKKLMPRLNQMFNRAQLTQEEIHILRGVAKAMLQSSPPKH